MQHCTQIARHLTGRTVATNDLLKETFGSDWHGETLKGLRARFGDEMAGRDNLGRDFRAPGGKSPRDVAERLKTLTYGESGRVRPADSGSGSPGCDPMCFCAGNRLELSRQAAVRGGAAGSAAVLTEPGFDVRGRAANVPLQSDAQIEI